MFSNQNFETKLKLLVYGDKTGNIASKIELFEPFFTYSLLKNCPEVRTEFSLQVYLGVEYFSLKHGLH